MKNKGRRYNDFTILYRTNAQSRLFEEGFLRYNIPYKVFGGMQFYQRAEIKDILAYMSVVNNTRDGINLDRIINVPKRKIGDKTIEKIKVYAEEKGLSIYDSLKEAENIPGLSSAVIEKLKDFSMMMAEFEELSMELSVSELFDEIIKKVGYFSYLNSSYDDAESRIENIEELKNSIIELSMELSVSELFDEIIKKVGYFSYLNSSYDDAESRIENIEELKNSIIELENVIDNLTLREYLENVSLVSATDDLDSEREYVKLMTIHNAKGLEFPVVFLVGMEDEIFPNTTKVMIDREALEEERRICYVAITRAEEKLYISHAAMRYMYGNMDYRTRSRFVDEIPQNLFEVRKNIAIETAVKEIERKINKAAESGMKLNIISDTKKLGKQLEAVKDFPYKVGDKVTHIKFGLGKVVGVAESGMKLNIISDTKKLGKQLEAVKDFPYKVGDKVTHIKFGLGKVVGVNEKKVQVQFVDGKKEIAMILADKFLKK